MTSAGSAGAMDPEILLRSGLTFATCLTSAW
jgi:hypothetical protein